MQQFLFRQPEFRALRTSTCYAMTGKGLIKNQTTGFKCLYQGRNDATIKKVTHDNDIVCLWNRRTGDNIPHLGLNWQLSLKCHSLQRCDWNIGNIPGVHLQTLLRQQHGIASQSTCQIQGAAILRQQLQVFSQNPCCLPIAGRITIARIPFFPDVHVALLPECLLFHG